MIAFDIVAILTTCSIINGWLDKMKTVCVYRKYEVNTKCIRVSHTEYFTSLKLNYNS